MKNSPKLLATPFMLIAALSAQFATLSYGAEHPDEPKLAFEILAAHNTFTPKSAERAAQEMAGHFLGKEHDINKRIDALAIDKLESACSKALSDIRSIANVGDDFNLLGDIPEDANALQSLMKQIQEGQKAQSLLEIACLKREVLVREAAEANEFFEFFTASGVPMALLLELKDFSITREKQIPADSNNQTSGYYQYGWHLTHLKDTPALAFIGEIKKGSVFLNTAHVARYFPVVASQPEVVQFINRIDTQKDVANKWLSDLPRIRELSLSAFEQAKIQQSIISRKYQPEALANLKHAEVVSYRNELRAVTELVNEKNGVLNVIKTFKEFVDDILEYLNKNSRIT